MRAAAILLAAGTGERLGGEVPKALIDLAGRSLLDRAVSAVAAAAGISGYVVAAPPGREDEIGAAASGDRFLAVVTGGDTRQASVALALEALPGAFDAVVCHDVARALASPALFDRVLEALSGADGVVPVLPVVDTVKRVEGSRVVETVPRESLGLAQTPQAFRRAALEDAHRRARDEGFQGTDDAALLERASRRVVTVPGEPSNLKITEPADLVRAEAVLRDG